MLLRAEGRSQEATASEVGLIATAASSSRINLAWNSSAGADSYNAKRSTSNGGPYTTIATGVSGLTLTSGGLASNTPYYYVVSAVNGGGESPNSAQASATTFADPPPAAPSTLTATAGKRKITLHWTDNSGNETGFKIERSADNANFAQIATVGAGVVTYTNSNLTSGATFHYRVRSTNASGDSLYSNTASATAR